MDSARAKQASVPSSNDQDGNGRTGAFDLTSRYLTGRGSDTARMPVARETRRPVDVFFPDRRSADDGDGVDLSIASAATGASTADRKVKSRPTMPRVKSVGTHGPGSEADPIDVHASVEQPGKVEGIATPVESPADGDGQVPTRVHHHGAIGDAELRTIPTGDIHPNPRQPREVFDEDDMDELVASIAEVGVLQPIVVRPVEGASPFELVMGERRWRAAQRAGLAEIPAIVRHTADTDLLRDALLENLHRSQLNPLEEAAAYEQLLEDFNCTQEELSSRIGRSRPQITNTLRLLRLPPLVQRRVASGVLSAGHARALLALVDPAEMERLAQKVVSEGLSVRATEELVSLQDGVRQVKSKNRAPRGDRHERLDYLANSLTDRLDTTVKITLGARKGKIAIDFASVDDLNRIMDLIGQSGATNSQS
ncbi:ParB/RepB/Spo0J family partition protein [Citricoccus sp.]|uniref:ParB/RepB/Spo0J family partition protein n=1 Tax=Citricoccus sp. TaxID=1978372 RepID=UPI0037BEE229